MPDKPLVYTCVALAAAGPLLLHGPAERDCAPRIELCAPSFLLSAPDEPAPESPLLIKAMEMAAFTGSTSSVPMWLSSAWLPPKV